MKPLGVLAAPQVLVLVAVIDPTLPLIITALGTLVASVVGAYVAGASRQAQNRTEKATIQQQLLNTTLSATQDTIKNLLIENEALEGKLTTLTEKLERTEKRADELSTQLRESEDRSLSLSKQLTNAMESMAALQAELREYHNGPRHSDERTRWDDSSVGDAEEMGG